MTVAPAEDAQEARFRDIFRAAHADHLSCTSDEWLNEPCRNTDGTPAGRPIIWSRRNGPWRRVPVLWVGAAPGNAGGRGSSDLGAHGTRIPFGGDIAGGNLDVLLSSIGMNRDETFIVAAYNQLPALGGGEPTTRELAEPVGNYPDSCALLRDTVIAAGPDLIVALGNIGLRTLVAALTRPYVAHSRPQALVLPGMARLTAAGVQRNHATDWPDELPLDTMFRSEWKRAWGSEPQLTLLPLLHPSAQNMSPFAGTQTQFHKRMLDTQIALRNAVHDVLRRQLPRPRPTVPQPTAGHRSIYALPEWRDRIAERHVRYDGLWREKGI